MPHLIFAINNSPSSALKGVSPIFCELGFNPKLPIDLQTTLDRPASDTDDASVEERVQRLTDLRENLLPSVAVDAFDPLVPPTHARFHAALGLTVHGPVPHGGRPRAQRSPHRPLGRRWARATSEGRRSLHVAWRPGHAELRAGVGGRGAVERLHGVLGRCGHQPRGGRRGSPAAWVHYFVRGVHVLTDCDFWTIDG